MGVDTVCLDDDGSAGGWLHHKETADHWPHGQGMIRRIRSDIKSVFLELVIVMFLVQKPPLL